MSASPSGSQNGVPRNSRKPKPLRPMRRVQRPANPVVASSRKPSVKPGQKTAANPPVRNAASNAPNSDELRKQYGGWSAPPPPYQYSDIPIMTTKRALLNGARHHLMRFYQSKMNDKPVDPTDQEAFARPVTLHRRDPRQPAHGRGDKALEPEQLQADEKEVERLTLIKAEREAQRAIDQAKIAPVSKETNPKRPKKQKEEKTMFNRAPKSEAAKKESDIRYEEALPWHLEDADGKNVWFGTYVAALSEASVAFMIDKSVFRMVPLEKWYKFTSKPPFQPFTIDEAEAFMNKKMDVGRWVMKDDERKAGQNDLEATRRLLYGRGQMVKTESDTFRAASRLEKLDHDELDISGDEFQDDDEAPNFERNDDEDAKESKDRIRREQLGANLFGEGDEQEVDKELQQQLREELERQKYGKATKKALIKRDREDIYASDDSEDNPWSSSSDDETSDEENDEGKDDDTKDLESKDGQAETKDKTRVVGSKGTATPHGKQKQPDLLKKGKSLKRAGSPALSESSGNESSRKKMKKTSGTATANRADTPLPQTTGFRRTKASGTGADSDAEAIAGDVSDGAGSRKKTKLAESGSQGTPAGSRASSPNPAQGGLSPTQQSATGIEPWEILEKIPADGIAIGDLIKPFHGRVGDRPGQMPKGEWIKLVKQLCDYGSDKRLRRRK